MLLIVLRAKLFFAMDFWHERTIGWKLEHPVFIWCFSLPFDYESFWIVLIFCMWYNNFDFVQLWWPHEFLWESILCCCFRQPSCIQISCTILIRVYILIPSSRLILSDLNITIIMFVLVSGTKQIPFFPRPYYRPILWIKS